MKPLSKKQQRDLVRVWDTTGPELERIRREELRGQPYDWKDVDALLEMADDYHGPPRLTSGLVEMQKWFTKAARRKGLLPTTVRETAGTYAVVTNSDDPSPKDARECSLYVYGDATVLSRSSVALFCSVKCPGKLILETYDLARRFREEGTTVISGFHSPMEQECLRILVRSPHPVIWCLARGVYRNIPSNPIDCRPAVSAGRLIMVTPFPNSVRHITAKTATERNRLVVDLASAVVVAHAAPGSKMEALCRDALSAGKPLYTFEDPANEALFRAGAKPIDRLASW